MFCFDSTSNFIYLNFLKVVFFKMVAKEKLLTSSMIIPENMARVSSGYALANSSDN